MENGYRTPSVAIQIRKQMRKLKQNPSVSGTSRDRNGYDDINNVKLH